MPDDDMDSSLSERARSLALTSPDLREFLLELTERVEQATAVEAVLARADAPRGLLPRGRHRRDRHGMYGIRGGMAAFAPAAFLGGRGWAVATLRWLWCTHWNRARMTAAALALGVMGATGSGTVAGPLPHARAAICTGRCEARQDAVQVCRGVTKTGCVSLAERGAAK